VARNPENPAAHLALASLERRAGRAERAEAVIRAGLERVKSPAELRWALVNLLWERGRWEDALAQLEHVSEGRRATDARAHLHVNAGIAARNEGRGDAALRHWEEALELRPDLTEASVYLGLQHLQSGNQARARRVVEAGLEHEPDEPRLLALQSATLEGREAAETAERALRSMRRERPGDERIGLELAGLLLSSRRVDEARALYDTLLAAPDPGPDVHGAAADLWLLLEHPDSAVAVLEEGVARHPEQGEIWRKLGEARDANGEGEGALAAYRRAASFLEDPVPVELAMVDVARRRELPEVLPGIAWRMMARNASTVALLEVSHRLMEAGAPALSDSVLSFVRSREPASTEAFLAAGAVAERRGRVRRAVALYRRALEVDTELAPSLLGILRLEPPESRDSLRSLTRRAASGAVARLADLERIRLAEAESGSRGAPAATVEEAWVQERWERLQAEARRDVERALDRLVGMGAWGAGELERLQRWYPASRVLLRYRAGIAARDGRWQEAVAMYDRLLRDRPEDAGLHRNRAGVLESLGRGDAAAESWTRALELDPESEEAFRALLRIHREDEILSELLDRIRRLRALVPESEVLVEREVELLQRLGHLGEARALMREWERKAEERDAKEGGGS